MLSCFLLLAGCAAKRDKYNVPALDLPKQYPAAPTVVDIANSKNITSPSPVSRPALSASSPLTAALAEWWRLLGSQELNGLMDRALANNPDLRIAALRIAQSKARLDQAGADKVPVVTLPAQVKNEYPEFGVGRGSATGNNKSRSSHQISLKGDWRPDIWGETESLYESAELQLLRATYQRDDMQRKVAADVAAAYIEYLSLNDRLKVARETENSLGEMLVSVSERLAVGDATITEMEQQKAAVFAVKATFPVLEQQRETVLNRLAALTGSAPVALKLSRNGLNSVKFLPVLPGVPSALLLRRPDVRAVEARMLAADADIDVARARVLPPLDLTAQIGYGSIYMSGLFTPQALFWSTIANLSATIFDSGKRSKEVEFAQAMHEELLETYMRVIYDAVREVDDSLSAISFIGKRLKAQGVAVDSSLRAWNYSQETYMAGAVDYLAVLDAQRAYQRNLDDWYSVRMDRYRGLINLFSALGGGVSGGDVMPGDGARPAPLADEADYGTVFAESGAKQGVEGAAQNRTGNIADKADNAVGEVAPTLFGKYKKREDDKARSREQANEAKAVDWEGNTLNDGKVHWLVELSGVYDRGAVLPAWRDLRSRFSQQLMDGRTLLPQRQGQVNAAGKERAAWYRLFIATFPDQKVAEDFCITLRAGQQRCEAVSSRSLEGRDGFVVPPASDLQPNAASGAITATTTAGAKVSGRNDKDGNPSDHADGAAAQDGQMPVEKTAEPEAVQAAAGLAAKIEAVRVAAEREARAAAEVELERLKAEQQALLDGEAKAGLAGEASVAISNAPEKLTSEVGRVQAGVARAKAEYEAREAAEAELARLKAEYKALLDEEENAGLTAETSQLKSEQKNAAHVQQHAAAEQSAKAEATREKAEREARAAVEAELERLKAEQKALLDEEEKAGVGAETNAAMPESGLGGHKP